MQRMMAYARTGKLDLILTKSISRSARNTMTLLTAVRELKGRGVDVYFEQQRIHSISGEGKLMLTILAGYAQEESRSTSENMKLRIHQNFEEGKVYSLRMLGYRNDGGILRVEESEAEIVKEIFRLYLEGNGVTRITSILNKEGWKTMNGYSFLQTGVRRILRNIDYMGALILQKSKRENHIAKKTLRNNVELKKYYVEENHEPLISMEDFKNV